MVSSTVYGVQELLERIYALLTQYGYEVWCSHTGTVPVFSTNSAFENCLRAVEKCDLFLGMITPAYGSGRDGAGLSITHQELLKAIELNKPRWLLAHDHVVFARNLLANLDYDTAEKREALKLKKSNILDDLRVIDMYNAAIRNEVELKDRIGNWVQTYVDPADALRFASAQFNRFQEVERFLAEQLAKPDTVLARVRERSA
jgi:hypothetical protein